MAKGESERSVQPRRLTLSQGEMRLGRILLNHALGDLNFVARYGFSQQDVEDIMSLRKKLEP